MMHAVLSQRRTFVNVAAWLTKLDVCDWFDFMYQVTSFHSMMRRIVFAKMHAVLFQKASFVSLLKYG